MQSVHRPTAFRRLRTFLLTALGKNPLARLWAARKSRSYGVTVSRQGDSLALSRGAGVIVLIAPKHFYFLPYVSQHFAEFAEVLPPEQRGTKMVVDLAAQPELLQFERRCIEVGATLSVNDDVIELRKDRRVMLMNKKHVVYAPDIARNFDIYFEPLVPARIADRLVLDFSKPGNLQRFANSGLEFEMSSFPEEESTIEDYFRLYHPQPGDLVFDLGAHCGYSTYVLSHLVGPTGRVVAFEPDPGTFAILERNVRRHQLTNVTLQQAAIGAKDGQMPFNAEGTIGSALSTMMTRETVGATVLVDVLSLDTAFARYGTPRFCKMDIEGAEVEALSTSSTLEKSGTEFAVDTNHWLPNRKLTKNRVEDIFKGRGFQVRSEATPLWTTWASPRTH